MDAPIRHVHEHEGFSTLDTDLHEGGSDSVKRVCIATSDIVGPVKNGGIGTAYCHLARLLAERGHQVVIAYVNGNAAEVQPMERTRVLYTGYGVDFEPIVPRPDNKYIVSQVRAPTWTFHDWLRTRELPFDILHVSDYRGLGYGALLAKLQGLAFGTTHFVVHGHGPTLWAVEGNRQLLSTEHELGWVFMERRSVELADTLTCGSAHLLGWMREAGYALPGRSFVWPNPFPVQEDSPEAVAGRAARNGAKLEEVVFFGRLEPRKGLVLFVDAIDRLVRRGRAPARITFLGKASNRIDGPGFIHSSTRDWPLEVRTFTEFGAEEAIAYLSQPGRLAVLPSLQENSSLALTECLHAGIPFLATATGGTPELVALEDRGRALAAPDHVALGERIAQLAAAPLRAVRPRWDFTRSLEVWSRWHSQSVPFEIAAARFAQRTCNPGTETPPVTVCIVHHERPQLVRMAVDSVLTQDYPMLDAVLVDDGSEGAEALRALDLLETQFAERGWRVIRQENRYLGAARNTAASAARGEWLLFLDDDNVLFPDAVSRLVRAAQCSGADCVPAASIRFSGDGDPRTDTKSHGAPIRFLGAARAWSRIRNVVGDACALVKREAFEAVEGFSEEYRVGLDDLSFFNRLIHAGFRIEPMPDPVYFYRFGKTSMKSRNRSAEAAQVRVLSPYIRGLPDEERAFSTYAATFIADTHVATVSQPRRKAHAMALAQCRSRLGIDVLEVTVLLDLQWVDSARKHHRHGAACELRRNGRVTARISLGNASGTSLRVPAGLRMPAVRDTIYSIHDAFSGETLSTLISPGFLRGRRVIGAVENRTRPEVRGWVLDPGNPRRIRRVAIHVDGRLHTVVNAGNQRADIARWKGTGGHHGFLWRIPQNLVAKNGACIDVFDADTGRPLSGSPARLADGQVESGMLSRR